MHEYCILINFEPKISLKKNFYLIALVLFDLISWQFDVQMKSKHTSIRIILIRLKCERKIFLGTREKKIHMITGWIFYVKIKLVSYDYVYASRRTFVWVFNYMSIWEKVHLKWSKICNFHFFHSWATCNRNIWPISCIHWN